MRIAGNSVTGTSGNDLIIGKTGPGVLTLNGGGGNDCIVGGSAGNTTKFDGSTGTGDV